MVTLLKIREATAPAEAAAFTMLQEQLEEVLESLTPGNSRFSSCALAWRMDGAGLWKRLGRCSG